MAGREGSAAKPKRPATKRAAAPKKKEPKNTWEPELWARHVAFGDALRQARKAAGYTQEDMESMGVLSQSTWSGMESPHPSRHRAEPINPDLVFEAEKLLGVDPGSLSKFLGYVPVSVVTLATSVEEALKGDPFLTDAQKENLRGIYRSLASTPEAPGERRARPKG